MRFSCLVGGLAASCPCLAIGPRIVAEQRSSETRTTTCVSPTVALIAIGQFHLTPVTFGRFLSTHSCGLLRAHLVGSSWQRSETTYTVKLASAGREAFRMLRSARTKVRTTSSCFARLLFERCAPGSYRHDSSDICLTFSGTLCRSRQRERRSTRGFRGPIRSTLLTGSSVSSP